MTDTNRKKQVRYWRMSLGVAGISVGVDVLYMLYFNSLGLYAGWGAYFLYGIILVGIVPPILGGYLVLARLRMKGATVPVVDKHAKLISPYKLFVAASIYRVLMGSAVIAVMLTVANLVAFTRYDASALLAAIVAGICTHLLFKAIYRAIIKRWGVIDISCYLMEREGRKKFIGRHYTMQILEIFIAFVMGYLGFMFGIAVLDNGALFTTSLILYSCFGYPLLYQWLYTDQIEDEQVVTQWLIDKQLAKHTLDQPQEGGI
jgi:hypothetical protein